MERLTHRYMGGTAWASIYKVSACGENECTGPIIGRLAAYEDAMPLERAQELAQAEKDGRLVALLPNDPLTLDQLREMDGEPVWVEIPKHHVAEWCVAKFDPQMGRTRLWCSGGGWFDGKNCGKSVFIYRRKPEEASP